MKKLLLGVIFTLLSHISQAELVTMANVNIDRLGAHNGNVFYMNLKEGFKTWIQNRSA